MPYYLVSNTVERKNKFKGSKKFAPFICRILYQGIFPSSLPFKSALRHLHSPQQAAAFLPSPPPFWHCSQSAIQSRQKRKGERKLFSKCETFWGSRSLVGKRNRFISPLGERSRSDIKQKSAFMGNPSEVRRSRSMKTKKGAQHVERMYQKVDRKKGEKNAFIFWGKRDTFGQSVTRTGHANAKTTELTAAKDLFRNLIWPCASVEK